MPPALQPCVGDYPCVAPVRVTKGCNAPLCLAPPLYMCINLLIYVSVHARVLRLVATRGQPAVYAVRALCVGATFLFSRLLGLPLPPS